MLSKDPRKNFLHQFVVWRDKSRSEKFHSQKRVKELPVIFHLHKLKQKRALQGLEYKFYFPIRLPKEKPEETKQVQYSKMQKKEKLRKLENPDFRIDSDRRSESDT